MLLLWPADVFQINFSKNAFHHLDPICLQRLSADDKDQVRKELSLTDLCTVKPVLSGLSKIDKTKFLMTNGSLM